MVHVFKNKCGRLNSSQKFTNNKKQQGIKLIKLLLNWKVGCLDRITLIQEKNMCFTWVR